MRRAPFAVIVTTLAAMCVLPASAQPISGRASTVDGDTLEIDGEMIRLHGIDAPEARQVCLSDGGAEWRCGEASAEVLHQRIGPRVITCWPLSRDRYKRVIARCILDGIDLGGWLVAGGWAIAARRFSVEYVEHEEEARRERRGLWAGQFDAPEDWRARRRP